MTLIDLLAQLPSNNLKLQLIKAHKKAALDHPVWLMLINHMDEAEGLIAVTNYLSDPAKHAELGIEFTELLSFSNKLVQLNQRLHALVKTTLLAEAGISHQPNAHLSIKKIISDGQLTESNLLELWRIAISKCAENVSDQPTTNTSLEYVIAQAIKSGEEVLKRAQSNPALLIKFMDTLTLLSEPYKKQILHTDEKHRLSLWSAPENKTLSPLFKIAQRSIIMLLIQTIEKFVLKYIPGDKLETYRTIANDPIYPDRQSSMVKLTEMLRQIMNQRDRGNTNALVQTLHLYRQAQQCLVTDKQLTSLMSMVDEMNQLILTTPELSANKPLLALANRLKVIMELNPMIMNDHHFQEKSRWEKMFKF
jgi:hypothetical protein